MASALKNVAVVGASGRLGPFILKALQNDPTFNVTVITRHESKAVFPDNTKILRVSDGYPDDEMLEAFRSQDAVVLSLSYAAEHRHTALVQASIKAGVKRLIADGYGSNDEAEAVGKMFPIAARKAEKLRELKAIEAPGWSWTSISCGLFFDFCIKVGFFGLNPTTHKATIWDDGNAIFSATTRESIGLSVARVLAKSEETANRCVFVSSVECSMNDILEAEKKATGVQDWEVTYVKTDEQIAAATKELQKTGNMMAMAKLALATNLKEEYKADFKSLGLLDNELLGIPEEKVDDIVARVLKGDV